MESMNSSNWSRSASVSSRGFLLRRVKSMSIAIAIAAMPIADASFAVEAREQGRLGAWERESLRLCVPLFLCLCLCLCPWLSGCLSVCPSVRPSAYPSVRPCKYPRAMQARSGCPVWLLTFKHHACTPSAGSTDPRCERSNAALGSGGGGTSDCWWPMPTQMEKVDRIPRRCWASRPSRLPPDSARWCVAWSSFQKTGGFFWRGNSCEANARARLCDS